MHPHSLVISLLVVSQFVIALNIVLICKPVHSGAATTCCQKQPLGHRPARKQSTTSCYIAPAFWKGALYLPAALLGLDLHLPLCAPAVQVPPAHQHTHTSAPWPAVCKRAWLCNANAPVVAFSVVSFSVIAVTVETMLVAPDVKPVPVPAIPVEALLQVAHRPRLLHQHT